ncbi:MAG: transposase, partial [Prevotella sp.]|nr:transposase [Prevotella sp.]
MKERDIIQIQAREIARLTKSYEELEKKFDKALAKIDSLLETIASLESALLAKGKSLEKEKNINKGLRKTTRNESERQKPKAPQKTEEEIKAEKGRRKAERKAKGNYGAKRNSHYECEENVIHVYPDTEGVEAERIRDIGVETASRYRCEPMRIIKDVYILHTQSVDGEVRVPPTPPSAFYKSNYDASFVAMLLELHHCHQMPVERIVKYVASNGFELSKPTAHHLIRKSAELMENLHTAMRQSIKEDNYMGCDETYSLVKLDMPNPKGKGKYVRKGYMWVAVGHNTGLVYFFYDDGSRKESVFVEFIKGYLGIIQSDGLKIYRKTGDDPDNGITRIACIQHIK